jgi:hypothetical protein
MKTFETLRAVVDNAIGLHHHAAAIYRQLDQCVSDPRGRMLLAYMADHQGQMEKHVGKVKQGAPESVLDTYIQFTLEEAPLRFLENLLAEIDVPGADDISALGGRVDDYLVDLFDAAAQEVDTAKGAEFLRELAELEQLERKKLTRTIASMMDM